MACGLYQKVSALLIHLFSETASVNKNSRKIVTNSRKIVSFIAHRSPFHGVGNVPKCTDHSLIQ